MADTETMLEVTNLTVSYGAIRALKGISFIVEQGEIISLIGSNGAGKTTMFNIITASYMPTTGEVIFDGVNLKGIKPHKIVNLGISRTFQNIRLFSSMSVLENVLIGLNSATKYSFVEAILHFGRFHKSEKTAKAKAMEILSELGIEKFANEKATSLAYGIQRKVEIARALATNPKLLLLDEPAAGMNPRESDDLANLIFDLRKRKNLTVLLIEHDMKFVNRLCDRVLVLDYGKVIFEGKPSDAARNKDVISAYLGDVDDIG